jgi:predicted AAA+ superfamily ATPase
VETVSAEPKYKPNEPGLSVAGLQQKLTELQHLNDTVVQAEIRLTQARRSRNELYYYKEGNLFSTALAAKQYVRGIFGYQSSQHQEVQRLNFTKPNL